MKLLVKLSILLSLSSGRSGEFNTDEVLVVVDNFIGTLVLPDDDDVLMFVDVAEGEGIVVATEADRLLAFDLVVVDSSQFVSFTIKGF